MRIAVLYNPISGAGRAATTGEAAANALRRAGHEVFIAHTRPPQESAAQWLDPLLHGMDLAVISGGDGAVRLVSSGAVRTRTPMYCLPSGTENLFAREFGMTRELPQLLQAVRQQHIVDVDTATANGEAFVLMASVGLDAEVVHELAATRTGPIKHSSYVKPILRQLKTWKPSILDVVIDGERFETKNPGFIVIANCKQYGWRLNPAARASMTDGCLDVAFFPARSWLGLARWAFRCRVGRQFRCGDLHYRCGKRITLQCAENCRYQIDGDPAATSPDETPTAECKGLLLDVEVRPSSLRVLLP